MSKPHPAPPRSVYFLLALMVLLWSVNFIVAKRALRDFPPLLAGALRFTVAGFMIAPIYAWVRRSERAPLWPGAGVGKLLAVGLLGVGVNQLTFLLGLVRTSVSHAAFIVALTPISVLLLAAATRHERLSHRRLIGFGIAVSGIAVLQGRALLGGHGSPLGDLFVFLSSLSFAFFTVGGKSIRRHFDGLTTNTFAYAGSAIVLSPLTLALAWSFRFATVSLGGWLSLFYMALFPSLVAYAIYYHALHYLPPSRIAMLSYLQPLLATSFAVLLLGERVTYGLVAGGLLVLAGVFWAERS